MKKIISLVLVLTFAFIISSCGSTQGPGGENIASEGYDRAEIQRLVYELDKENPETGLNYVIAGLHSGNLEIPKACKILEDVREKSGHDPAYSDKITDAWLMLASGCLQGWYARAYDAGLLENIFAASVAGASESAGLSGKASQNPFLDFLKAVKSGHEGNKAGAVRHMKAAKDLAPGNIPVDFWLAAQGKDRDNAILKTITLGDLGVTEGYFDTYTGVMWLGENRVFVTVTKRGENYTNSTDLLLLDIDTLAAKQIYSADTISLVFVSPDGKFVVLHEGGSNDEGLVLVNVETGKKEKISGLGYQYAVSPDGKKLAYTESGIWVYDFDSGSKEKVSNGRDDASPVWYPDGKSLLYIGDLGGRELGDGAGHLQGIFKLSLEGPFEKERILNDWEGKYHYLEWIQEGAIVHVAQGWDDGLTNFVVDLKKNSSVEVSSIDEGDHYELFYNRKGTRIYMPNYNGSIKVADLFGKTLDSLQFNDVQGYKVGMMTTNIEVLSDGRLLVFSELPLENRAGLWLTDKEMKNPIFLVWNEGIYNPQKAIVSPGGKTVLISSGVDFSTLCLVNLEALTK